MHSVAPLLRGRSYVLQTLQRFSSRAKISCPIRQPSRSICASRAVPAAGDKDTSSVHSPASSRSSAGSSASRHRAATQGRVTGGGQAISPGAGRRRTVTAADAAAAAQAGTMANDKIPRDLDLVVWGSTGFVGKLVCERLAKVYQVRAHRHNISKGVSLSDGHCQQHFLCLRWCRACLASGRGALGHGWPQPGEAGGSALRCSCRQPRCQGGGSTVLAFTACTARLPCVVFSRWRRLLQAQGNCSCPSVFVRTMIT